MVIFMKRIINKICNIVDRCFPWMLIASVISFFIIIFPPESFDATPLIIICSVIFFSTLILLVIIIIQINSKPNDKNQTHETAKTDNNITEPKTKCDIGVAVGINCPVCGKDSWLTVDNNDAIHFICSTHHTITYIKADYINNFVCDKCGCPKGQLREDDKKIDVICENCFEKKTVFEKPEIIRKNRNGRGIIIPEKPKIIHEPLIKCPKCGSTQITAGARGVNFTTGFIGASKTVNRCMKCGHTWKPHK